ncbi:MAG: hypothetical protein RLZ12_691 [Bacillota bacterium]|jgi:large subunit ribosomal protein L22
MIIRATARNLRLAPRKARLVVDLIRGKKVDEAIATLNFTHRAASSPLAKLLKSAIANARDRYELEADQLKVTEIFVDEGPVLKRRRYIYCARGRASLVRQRTSHITLGLGKIS